MRHSRFAARPASVTAAVLSPAHTGRSRSDSASPTPQAVPFVSRKATLTFVPDFTNGVKVHREGRYEDCRERRISSVSAIRSAPLGPPTPLGQCPPAQVPAIATRMIRALA